MRSNIRFGGQANTRSDASEQLSLRIGEIIQHSTHQYGIRSKQKRAGANRRTQKRESIAIEEEKREKNGDIALAKERRGD